MIYAGNHGLEIEGTGLAFEHPRAVELKAAVREITGGSRRARPALEGIEIESKGLTSSMHYRRAPRSIQVRHRAIAQRPSFRPDDPKIEIREGKMVHRDSPSRSTGTRGRPVAWIRDQLGQSGALPIVLGDDMTDENAFTAFDDAITICVGSPPTDRRELPAREPRRCAGVSGVACSGVAARLLPVRPSSSLRLSDSRIHSTLIARHARFSSRNQ